MRTAPNKERAEEMARIADSLYANVLRAKVETEDNIGKMIIIDVDSGDYEIDPNGLTSADLLYDRHPDASLYGIRIGYRTAAAIGGAMQRTAP